MRSRLADTLASYEERLPREERRELLEAILGEGQRLDRYIQNLLDMTRLGHGTLKLNRDWTDAAEIVVAAVARLRKLFPELRVDTQLPAETVLLYVLPGGARRPRAAGHLARPRQVSLDDAPLALTRKEYAVLAMLLRHAGRVVAQQQLLRERWGASHVEDTHYLRIVLGKLRQKLGDDPASPRWLKTEPGVGYRFLGGG